MPRLALATCAELPALTEDDRRARDALVRRGLAVEAVVWDAPGPRWEAYDAVIVRSCWDYHRRMGEFLAWTGTLERAGARLWNDAATVRWNADKSYLRALEAAGVSVVPTVWLEPGSDVDLAGVLERKGWTEAVVKPAVSASAEGTWLTDRVRARAEGGAVKALLERDRVLLQPRLPEVAEAGEWSLVFFAGAFSHAVRKRPPPGDFRVQEEFGGRAEREDPPPGLIDQATRALNAAGGQPLYGRVDGIERHGRLHVMELELIEPDLFFRSDPGAPARFADAVLGRLARGRNGGARAGVRS